MTVDLVSVLRFLAGNTTALATRPVLAEAADEIERLRLTDAERLAIAWAVASAENCQHPADDTLRGLLERTK